MAINFAPSPLADPLKHFDNVLIVQSNHKAPTVSRRVAAGCDSPIFVLY